VYVFDLGGASGSTYEGGPDENVFDITIGVAITIFAKTGKPRQVWYRRLGGTRIQKYQTLAHENVENSDWIPVRPATPNYFFVPHSIAEAEEGSFYSLRDIFKIFGVGIYTARDALTTAFTVDELASRIKAFSGLSADEARKEFKLGKDAEAWSVERAQDDIKRTKGDRRLIRKLKYRPFDDRVTYYTGKSSGFVSRPTNEVMRHLLRAENPSLVTCRLLTTEIWTHALITDGIIDNCYISGASRERAYAFPLYLDSDRAADSIQNFSPDFRAFIDARYEHHYTPEEILGYIYAVLHAPTYRTRYAESLRIDFPRVPFADSADDFEMLSKLGWALIQAHLLRELPRKKLADYHGKGDHTVGTVRYSPQQRSMWINETQFFGPVPQDVRNFKIGGYQVLEKYLKSRKGRALSLEEINHVSAIADSLAFTIQQMAKIDEAYQTAFVKRG
jgi:predicted helicase